MNWIDLLRSVGDGVKLAGDAPANEHSGCSVPRCGGSFDAVCAFPLTGPRAGEACGRPLCGAHGAPARRCPAHARLEAGASKIR